MASWLALWWQQEQNCFCNISTHILRTSTSVWKGEAGIHSLKGESHHLKSKKKKKKTILCSSVECWGELNLNDQSWEPFHYLVYGSLLRICDQTMTPKKKTKPRQVSWSELNTSCCCIVLHCGLCFGTLWEAFCHIFVSFLAITPESWWGNSGICWWVRWVVPCWRYMLYWVPFNTFKHTF